MVKKNDVGDRLITALKVRVRVRVKVRVKVRARVRVSEASPWP